MDLALNNLQWLMCHKINQNKTTNPLELEPHHQMQFRVILRPPIGLGGLTLCKDTVSAF